MKSAVSSLEWTSPKVPKPLNENIDGLGSSAAARTLAGDANSAMSTIVQVAYGVRRNFNCVTVAWLMSEWHRHANVGWYPIKSVRDVRYPPLRYYKRSAAAAPPLEWWAGAVCEAQIVYGCF